MVLRDLLKNGLSKKKLLLKSNFYNTQSTCCIADIDYDGENEILIGTYGQVCTEWNLSRYAVVLCVKSNTKEIIIYLLCYFIKNII